MSKDVKNPFPEGIHGQEASHNDHVSSIYITNSSTQINRHRGWLDMPSQPFSCCFLHAPRLRPPYSLAELVWLQHGAAGGGMHQSPQAAAKDKQVMANS